MPTKHGYVAIHNRTKESLLAPHVQVADSILSRLIGLLGKRSLEPGSGVWIFPSNSAHTIGMLFAIDLILIDKGLQVVGLHESVRPFSVTLPNFRAESMIELPPHTILKSHTEIGDQLQIERCEAEAAPRATIRKVWK
ncbi:MAG: DUF192 domain-containing protein [Terriglobia bacterium]